MKWILYLVLLAFILLINSCSRKIIVPPSAENLTVFPSPPDKPKVQFLTYINSSADVEKPAPWVKRFFVGKETPKSIFRPYGMSSYEDEIYVCDPKIRGLEIINIESGSFEYFVPTGLGELKMPLNCFVDSSKNLYVSDSYRKQIVVFDRDLKYLNAFGETDDFKPIDLFVNDDKIFVTNLQGNCFNIYDKETLELLNSYPKLESGDDGFLYKPTSIAVNGGEVYVTDFGEAKIKVYDMDGNFKRSIGSYGRGMGQFVRPKEIGFDQSGNLYVVDAAFENVQIFNKEGQLLMYMGRPVNMNLPAGIGFSYNNIDKFRDYVYEDFTLKFIIFVSNQFGSNKIGVYGFIEEK